MKTKLRGKVSYVFFVFVILSFLAIPNKSAAQDPYWVTLTGTFVPAKDMWQLYSYAFLIGDQKKLFSVSDIDVTVPHLEETDWSVLRLVFPPNLLVVGDQSIMQKLKQDNLEGKRCRINAILYPSNNMIFINSMNTAEKKSQKD